MKSITVHGIDDALATLIQDRARSEGLSVNKTIKRLLERALGAKPNAIDTSRAQFEEFAGVWSSGDLEDFEGATADLRKVDEGDWP
ncbi:MAG: hypothetical protein HY815_09160 [Candidatus Riflebacteria bacterium]|nr:hypothetical protein [Candidatus Riflebacteria bacterium]